MESQSEDIGRVQLPANFNQCYRAATVQMDLCECYLLGGWMPGVGGDPSCKACVGHTYVKEQYRKWVEGGGEAMGLRVYRRRHVLENDWVATRLANRYTSQVLGL